MFRLTYRDKDTKARLGKLKTPHGEIQTPCFLPVATQGTVKTLSNQELDYCQVQIILANTYHLYLRPGTEVIREAGGLHNFISWPGPILTDSGGYQIFSLAALKKVNNEGVEFQSHLDGSRHFLTPEEIIEIQGIFNSDIIMPLDECLSYPCDYDYAKVATRRTLDWAKRSQITYRKLIDDKHLSRGDKQLLFGIIQGSTYFDLRKEATEKLLEMGFAGFALGGISVGEPKNIRYNIMEEVIKLLPEDKPRYLMGMGNPGDIIEAVGLGCDLFDCCIPTRLGRNGTAFIREGKITVRDAPYILDFKPLDESCHCYTCRNFSRASLRHMINTKEILGLRLVCLHNIYFYMQLMKGIREAIKENRLRELKKMYKI